LAPQGTFQNWYAYDYALYNSSLQLPFSFLQVAADGKTVVGEPLVAKESKFVEASANAGEQSQKFVRRFCRINHQAQKAADAFNAKLDSIQRLDPDTVRVSFLPCSMYCINDPEKGRHALGVERRLFGQFQKWNSNNGVSNGLVVLWNFVSCQLVWLTLPSSFVLPQWLRTRSPRKSSSNLAPIKEKVAQSANSDEGPLAAIKEEDMEPDAIGSTAAAAIEIDMDVDEDLFVSHNDVAQAFSHFSYIYGGRKSLICDLQGVVDRETKVLQFTDPVVHYHDVFKENKRGQYGRTDLGERGIQYFLKSHDCNCLCEVATKGFMEVIM